MKHERQVLMPGWEQDKVRSARVLVVGCGALGSAVAHVLARAGVGYLGLVDPDRLEEHNLENQVYDEQDLGKMKVVALKERLLAIDPSLTIDVFWSRIEDVYDAAGADYLLGCLDNVAGRHFLNYVAVRDAKGPHRRWNRGLAGASEDHSPWENGLPGLPADAAFDSRPGLVFLEPGPIDVRDREHRRQPSGCPAPPTSARQHWPFLRAGRPSPASDARRDPAAES